MGPKKYTLKKHTYTYPIAFQPFTLPLKLPLAHIFMPRSKMVVGATENKSLMSLNRLA